MKNVIAVIVCVFALAACKTNQSSAKIDYVKAEEPMHKKDRRINDAGKNSTENSGASGAGSGSSYASTSFRQTAIKKASTNAPKPNQVVSKTSRETTKRW